MPAAIAIPAIIGAVGSVASAKIASNASKSAAQTQANAGTQALNYQQQMFNTLAPYAAQQSQYAQQSFSPYQQLGGAATNALYQRLGLGQYGGGNRQPFYGVQPPPQPPMGMQPLTAQPQPIRSPFSQQPLTPQPQMYGQQPTFQGYGVK